MEDDEGRRKVLKVKSASSEMEDTTTDANSSSSSSSSVTYPSFSSSPPRRRNNNHSSDYGFSEDTLIKCIRGRRGNVFIHRRPGPTYRIPEEHDRFPLVCVTGDFTPPRLGVIPNDDSMTEAIKQSSSYKRAVANGLVVKLMGTCWEARLPTCNDDHNRDQATP